MGRFYANENIPALLVQAMRMAGLDTRWATEDAPSEADEIVLAKAMRENRVLLTFDLDFGQLAFQARLPATCGVILLRLPQESPSRVADFVLAVLQSRTDWSGHFSVIEPGNVRMTALPSAPAD